MTHWPDEHDLCPLHRYGSDEVGFYAADYRVRRPDVQVFDLFRNAVSGLWALDRAHD